MNDNSTFTLLDPEFWLPLNEKPLTDEFRAAVERLLPAEGWNIQPRGVWTEVVPQGWAGAAQGWKLHLSATPWNAHTILQSAVAVMRDDPVAFKFASDPAVLRIILSKNWPRGGGGKFITIYPATEDQFRRLSASLVSVTAAEDGPYILSDRRVPGSMVVFYRYGEHHANESLDPSGARVHNVVDSAGERVPDRRLGYYSLPSWVQDPYGARTVRVLDPEGARTVLQGRYEIQGAIRYSNLGGIYYAKDLHDYARVIVRERRPGVGWTGPHTDAVALLAKEGRILRRMAGTGVTPSFIDAFQLWEHHYLVMEDVPGSELRDYALSRYFKRQARASPRRLFVDFRRLIFRLVDGIEEFHKHGIILRDLSVGNVLVRRNGTICFIDFEYAWEKEGDQPFAAGIHTPGFASPEQMAGQAPSEADDFHALGAIVVEICAMLAPGLRLNRDGVLKATGMMLDEVGLPGEFLETAKGLLEPDRARRWNGDDVRNTLRRVRASSLPWKPEETDRQAGRDTPPPRELEEQVRETCESVCRFFEAVARPQRTCLWPATPETYETNPVCIRYGACGPVEYVRRWRRACPGDWLHWIETRATPDSCPPGLHVGLAGVAMVLAVCGRKQAAARILQSAIATPLLPTHAALYDGAAGVALACLAVSDESEGPTIDYAVRIGDELARRAVRRAKGIAWPTKSGVVASGLAGGGAGIALFFTYLGARTGENRYWELARRALDYEFAQVIWSGGHAFWPATGGRHKSYSSPHVSFGSAGIGAVALRLHVCTGEPDLRLWSERCAEALTFRWTNKLWQDMGFAGWGETLLDTYLVTGDERWRSHALRIAEALLPHRVQTRFGTAFPSGGLSRVASDFGMGASGIATFLHRVISPGVGRAFFPDHLLPGWPIGLELSGVKPWAAAGLSRSAAETTGEAAAPRPAGRARGRAPARTPA